MCLAATTAASLLIGLAAHATIVPARQDKHEQSAPMTDTVQILQRAFYAHIIPTPTEKTIHDRWNTMVAQPDVQAALEKVGRVENFPIAPGLR